LGVQGVEIDGLGLMLRLRGRRQLRSGKQTNSRNRKSQRNKTNTHRQASWPAPPPDATLSRILFKPREDQR
jgi:hypothetical protein